MPISASNLLRHSSGLGVGRQYIDTCRHGTCAPLLAALPAPQVDLSDYDLDGGAWPVVRAQLVEEEWVRR